MQNQPDTAVRYFEAPGFIGTSHYHRITLVQRFLATDGALHVFQALQCFWLADVIASHLGRLTRHFDEFGCWIYAVKCHLTGDGGAVVIFEDGDHNRVFSQKIPWTDLKENVKLWVTKEEDGRYICLLPSEY